MAQVRDKVDVLGLEVLKTQSTDLKSHWAHAMNRAVTCDDDDARFNRAGQHGSVVKKFHPLHTLLVRFADGGECWFVTESLVRQEFDMCVPPLPCTLACPALCPTAQPSPFTPTFPLSHTPIQTHGILAPLIGHADTWCPLGLPPWVASPPTSCPRVRAVCGLRSAGTK